MREIDPRMNALQASLVLRCFCRSSASSQGDRDSCFGSAGACHKGTKGLRHYWFLGGVLLIRTVFLGRTKREALDFGVIGPRTSQPRPELTNLLHLHCAGDGSPISSCLYANPRDRSPFCVIKLKSGLLALPCPDRHLGEILSASPERSCCSPFVNRLCGANGLLTASRSTLAVLDASRRRDADLRCSADCRKGPADLRATALALNTNTARLIMLPTADAMGRGRRPHLLTPMTRMRLLA